MDILFVSEYSTKIKLQDELLILNLRKVVVPRIHHGKLTNQKFLRRFSIQTFERVNLTKEVPLGRLLSMLCRLD